MTRPRDIADSINRIDSSAADATAMTIDSSENVGIGTNSPASSISGSATVLQINDGNVASIALNNTGASTKFEVASVASDALIFSDNGTERMRVTSTGDLLVGKSTTAIGTAGSRFISNGQIQATASGQEPYFANRLSSDGVLFDFRKDGTTVGSIKCRSSGGNLQIDTVQSGIDFGGDGYLPMRNGSIVDNNLDIGSSSFRYNDAFVTNGVTTGSDQNEKQQIASLTDSEIAAAKRISNGFKTFKWNDAVAAKGDNARTHTGVIAQEVRTALETEGLSAGNYAFFMSDTWWETQTDVPAVEAVEAQDAVYDDDGNLVSEAVEAVESRDAYTRTDTYDTADEAPEGATERTRLGIRYPELLAFVGAATEQRLTSIEARLTALENVE
jgi:hypothetical protein